MRRPALACVLVCVLVASACSGDDAADPTAAVTTTATSGPSGTAGGGGTTTTATATTEAGDGQLVWEDLGIGLIEVDPQIASPGDTVSLRLPAGAVGEVVLVGAGVATPITDGTAAMALPADLAPGVHAVATANGLSAGSLRVVDGPTVWVEVDRRIGGPDVTPFVEVGSHGLDDGLHVVLEVDAGSGIPETMVADPVTGSLLPVTLWAGRPDDVPDALGRHALGEGFVGSVQAQAVSLLSDDDEPVLESAKVFVDSCDSGSRISGDLGSAGHVRAVWLDGGFAGSDVETETGAFSLAVASGPVMVRASTRPLAGAEVRRIGVRVGCGETVDVGDLTEAPDQGPLPGEILGGATYDDVSEYRLGETGDLAFEREGLAFCERKGTGLQIELDPLTGDPSLFVEVDDYRGTGVYEGRAGIGDPAGGTATLRVEAGEVEGLSAVGATGTLTVDGSTIDLWFICADFSGLSSMAPISGIRFARRAAAFAGTGMSTCRTAVIVGRGPSGEIIAEYWAAFIADRAPRLQTTTPGDVAAILEVETMRQLLGSTDATSLAEVAGALDADLLIRVEMTPFGSEFVQRAAILDARSASVISSVSRRAPTPDELVDPPGEFLAAIASALICGESDPTALFLEAGGIEPASYVVTDLGGREVDGVEVTVTDTECGEWNPEAPEPAGARSFITNLEAIDAGRCRDTVTFRAELRTSDGRTVDTDPDADVSKTDIYVLDWWELSTELLIDNGADRISAESVVSFGVLEDLTLAAIGASGNGTVFGDLPNFPCVIIEPGSGVREEPNAATANGRFDMHVAGTYGGEGDPVFRLSLVGSGAKWTATYENPLCFPPGTMENEAFSGLLVLIPALLPLVFTGSPTLDIDAVDGTEKTLPITFGTGSGTLDVRLRRIDPTP